MTARRRQSGRRPLRRTAAGGGLATVTDVRRYAQPIGPRFYLTHPTWLADEVRWWLRPHGPARRWVAHASTLGATLKWRG